MTDADSSLKVAIESSLDPSGFVQLRAEQREAMQGAVASAKAQDQVTNVTEEGAEATTKATFKMQEYRAAMRALAYQVPGLGILMRAFYSGWTAAIVGFGIAMRMLTRHLDDVNKRLDEMGREARRSLSDLHTAQRQIAREDMAHPVRKLIDALKATRDASRETTDAFVEDTQRRLQMNNEEVEALKKAALALLEKAKAAGMPEAEVERRRAEIEDTFALIQARNQAAAADDIMAEKERRHKQTTEDLAKVEAELAKLEKDKAARRRLLAEEGLSKTIAQQQEQLANLAKQAEEAAETVAGFGYGGWSVPARTMPIWMRYQLQAEKVVGGGPLHERFKAAGIDLAEAQGNIHELWGQMLDYESIEADRQVRQAKERLERLKDRLKREQEAQAAYEEAFKNREELWRQVQQEGAELAKFYDDELRRRQHETRLRQIGAMGAGPVAPVPPPPAPPGMHPPSLVPVAQQIAASQADYDARMLRVVEELGRIYPEHNRRLAAVETKLGLGR